MKKLIKKLLAKFKQRKVDSLQIDLVEYEEILRALIKQSGVTQSEIDNVARVIFHIKTLIAKVKTELEAIKKEVNDI